MSGATVALVLAGGAAAGVALRHAWRAGGARRPWLIITGWGVAAAAVAVAVASAGAAPGTFLALALIPVAVLALVTAGVKVRDARTRAPRELALEPSDRASKAWRGWLRGLLAGPIGGVAAMGVGLAFVVWVPGAPQTRMVLGGMLVPVLWAAGMAWTLADDRILRATAVLVGVALVTFAASALKGFAV
ncbi:MAG: hypothetical protein EPO51_26045 [Phenylobacterium sp.]|uniref:hypothetical protein n=1 Tax=Phenylobacterium sp. TaxID=1871053 RepID=UPI0012012131|nr:hypothetical protein [Phenylobacterium sp.]TAJ68985.1 MAG: hypothetical protein EPO51_26045 [Phenylobacterium sp.]